MNARLSAALIFVVALIPALGWGWAESDDDDFFIDAPWRTMRDTLPVIFFAPETDSKTIVRLELSNYDIQRNAVGDAIFVDLVDSEAGERLACRGSAGTSRAIAIIDPEGRARGGLTRNETVRDFWHYIVRVPVACIGFGGNRGRPGVHHVLGEMEVRKGDHRKTYSRLMRVAVDRRPLPRFAEVDRHYDIHIHTVAEQTTRGPAQVDAARKMFGGPLAMVVESAWALGLVDQRLADGNWPAFRNLIATTDHNVFFSGGPYDAAAAPGYGPTAVTDGAGGEFAWYRDHLGEMAGEEVTLEGSGRVQHSDHTKYLGSHYLAYGAPHFEGPWHGGRFKAPLFWGYEVPGEGVDNPNSVEHVHRHMGGTNGFGYAAHPFSQGIGWSPATLERAIGLPPYNDRSGGRASILNAAGDDFVFKGLQVWNGLETLRTPRMVDIEEQDHLDPFTGNEANQRFLPYAHALRGRDEGLEAYYRLLGLGLRYAFLQEPERRFIRKLYISAGTDAHGDFNFETSGLATALAEADDITDQVPGANVGNTMRMSSNAFGILRTYTLTSERMLLVHAPSGPIRDGSIALGTRTAPGARTARLGSEDPVAASVEAYRDGNTVLTSNPICKFRIDANCRHDSSKGRQGWHDASCTVENSDGAIGGSGPMDGGRTALVVRDQSDAWVETLWDDLDAYTPFRESQSIRYTMVGVGPKGPGPDFELAAGPRRVPSTDPLTFRVGQGSAPSALLLKGRTSSGHCVTNPVWTVPVDMDVTHPGRCPFEPGELRVVIQFGISMDPTVTRRSCVGKSRDCVALTPASGISRKAGGSDLIRSIVGAAAYRGAEVSIQPLDRTGSSDGDGYLLTGNTRWGTYNVNDREFPKIQDAGLTVTNSQTIPCPAEHWDGEGHRPGTGRGRGSILAGTPRSYAIVVTELRDTHGNPLNAVGKTLTLRNGAPAPARPLEPGGEATTSPSSPAPRPKSRGGSRNRH